MRIAANRPMAVSESTNGGLSLLLHRRLDDPRDVRVHDHHNVQDTLMLMLHPSEHVPLEVCRFYTSITLRISGFPEAPCGVVNLSAGLNTLGYAQVGYLRCYRLHSSKVGQGCPSGMHDRVLMENL